MTLKQNIRRLRAWMPQYRQNLTLALPVVLSQIGQVVVQLVDNAMVGRLGAVPLASISFGSAVFVLFMYWGTGLCMGLTPLVGEAYARKDYRGAARYLQNSLSLYTLMGLGLFLGLLFIGMFLDHMGQDPSVVQQGKPYFQYLAWSIIPLMIFSAFKQFLEGIGNTKTGMVIILSANLLNIFFNYLFIYGNWGFPVMGAAGAGLATMISRVAMLVFAVIYFACNTQARRFFTFFSKLEQGWRWVKDLLRVGFPIAMQMLLEVSAFALTLIMMGWLGTVELAAHQIVISMSSFVFMMQVGISAATTIMISHHYGLGNVKGIRRAATASYHLSMVTALLTMVLFIVLRFWIPRVFTIEEPVILVAGQLLIMAGLYQIPDGLQVISLGVLRGMQDVKVTMYYAFLSYIVINLPVGYYCAFILGWGAPGLWVGFIVGLSIAAVLLYRRFRSTMRLLTTARSS